jgi:hypothetical protein
MGLRLCLGIFVLRCRGEQPDRAADRALTRLNTRDAAAGAVRVMGKRDVSHVADAGAQRRLLPRADNKVLPCAHGNGCERSGA